MLTLDDNELIRYNRQINLKNVDIGGQEKIKNSAVLVVGLGGLGCAAAQYLAAAGVGNLTLLDFDTVSLSNLQRQILHTDETIDIAKVDSAKRALSLINPLIEIEAINKSLSHDEFSYVVTKFDVVVDCSDNLCCREMLDDACLNSKTPLVSGAAIRLEGQVSVFIYKNENSVTYRSLSQLFGTQELSCSEAGVLSPIVGVVGSIQALETLKIILGLGEVLEGRLLMIDGLTMKINEFKLPTSN